MPNFSVGIGTGKFAVFTAGAWALYLGGPNYRLGPGIDLDSTIILVDDGNTTWTIDGVPLTFLTLPTGFVVTAASVSFVASISAGGFNGGATAHWHVIAADGSNSADKVSALFGLTVNALLIRTGSWRVNGTLPGNFGDHITLTIGGTAFRVDGTYTIVSWSWTINPPNGTTDIQTNYPSDIPDDGSDSDKGGDIITVTSNGNPAVDLDLENIDVTIEYLKAGILTYVSIQPILVTPLLYEFTIPYILPDPGTLISVNATGTQFTGSISLGYYTILNANGSGMYIVTPGNTHDVLYSSDRDGTTRNVKIPNVFAKTGFIGG